MNIALIGYGKMGKAIEQIALDKGDQISHKINRTEQLSILLDNRPDVAIEFSNPDSGYENIKFCVENQIPVVSGTTGWLDRYNDILELCENKKGTFFYASNFSVGVNIFFKLNEQLAKVMNNFNEYDVKMEEIHHTQKLDAPSGTAITLAEGIINNINAKSKWENESTLAGEDVQIISKRIENVPGTHTIMYNSSVDTIEIKHEAHNRTGFASGAHLAARFIKDKTGVYNMDDLLKI